MIGSKTKKLMKTFKILAISDTHSSTKQLQRIISQNIQGDIFIHCGDFTRYGRENSFDSFFTLINKIKFKYKIIVAGNHQIALDPNIKEQKRQKLSLKFPCTYTRQEILQKLTQSNCIYLQHSLIQLQGIRIFGSPYTPKYGNSAFQIDKQTQQHLWSMLPNQIDILITHGPPYKILDRTNGEKNAGSEILLKYVERIKPKLHFFGHIHEAKGIMKNKDTQFYNVAKQIRMVQFNVEV